MIRHVEGSTQLIITCSQPPRPACGKACAASSREAAFSLQDMLGSARTPVLPLIHGCIGACFLSGFGKVSNRLGGGPEDHRRLISS